jgi:hypothetical protein
MSYDPKHPDTPTARIKLSRRALLRQTGFLAGVAYVAPAVVGLDVARASGASGGGSGPSRPSPRTERAGDVQRPRNRRPASPAPPRPELVALVPLDARLDVALSAGYVAQSQVVIGSLSQQLVRFALPAGRNLNEAVAELVTLLPGTLADANHAYTPDDFLCDGADCAAQAMIGWSGWPSAMRPRLGMIDTGINTDHPALQGRRLTVHQLDLGDRAAAGRQHGTAIAAMLVGNVAGRVPGLLPDAELIAVEAFHRASGAEQADAFSVSEALDLLIGAEVEVINLSFSGPPNAVLEAMILRAAEAGIGLVAAAGNGGPGASPAYPAAWPQVVAVTAVDAGERIYRQANQGPYVMLAAPGVNVWTAASVAGGRLRSGTSYATPFVTAALAVERMRTPEQDLGTVTGRLFACARDLGETGYDPVFGHGMVAAPGRCEADARFFSLSGE